MAERGRFPVLYWASIFLLLLMLAFTGWYFLQNRHPLCRNDIDDALVRGQLERFWRQERIVVLSSAPRPIAQAYLQAALGEGFQVSVQDTCWDGLAASAALSGEGNRLLLLPVDCFESQLRVETADQDLLFLVMPARGQEGAPSVLACGNSRSKS